MLVRGIDWATWLEAQLERLARPPVTPSAQPPMRTWAVTVSWLISSFEEVARTSKVRLLPFLAPFALSP